MSDDEPLGPDGEALVYLNEDSGTYHGSWPCGGDSTEPVNVGECLFDPACSPCGKCY